MKSRRYRFRIIVPAYPSFNIYSSVARITTALGPVCVGTLANKLDNWDVEIIDENNCPSKLCPRDSRGHPDHRRIQADRPADVVGLYGSLSCTIPRLFELSKLFHDMGVTVVAGGKHVEALPGESLENDVDIAVIGDGEDTIREILVAFETGAGLTGINGIAFREGETVVSTPPRPLIADFSTYPLPDFGLVRYARIKMYPLMRVRGCDNRCEFCAVRDRTRCASPQWMMDQIIHLVETRKAHDFFEASDHFAANLKDAIAFCELLAEYQTRIGRKFTMSVQTRITDARHPELLSAMRKANITTVCIGYESPIDEELIAMRKGYLAHDMVKWTEEFHKNGFFIHGMFIFGYPQKQENQTRVALNERVQKFKQFIKEAGIDTIQILLTVPLPGTDLRTRLEDEHRLYPLDKIGWQFYDGQFPLYEPDPPNSPEELQRAVGKLMSRFYHFKNFISVSFTILFHFPRMVFPSTLSLITLKVRYLKHAFSKWQKSYFRNRAMRIGGFFIIKNWIRAFRRSDFLERLKLARSDIKTDTKQNISRYARTDNPPLI